MVHCSVCRKFSNISQSMTVNMKQQLNKWEKKNEKVGIEKVAFSPMLGGKTIIHIVISDNNDTYLEENKKVDSQKNITADYIIGILDTMKQQLLDDISPDFTEKESLNPTLN